MKHKILILTALFITFLVISITKMSAQDTGNKSNPTRSVKLTYVEDWESKKGVEQIEIFLAYKNPTTSEFTLLTENSGSKGTVIFDIPADNEGNSWPFVYGSSKDNIFNDLMKAKKEGKKITFDGFHMIRVHKSTEGDVEITFGGGRMTVVGNIQVWN